MDYLSNWDHGRYLPSTPGYQAGFDAGVQYDQHHHHHNGGSGMLGAFLMYQLLNDSKPREYVPPADPPALDVITRGEMVEAYDRGWRWDDEAANEVAGELSEECASLRRNAKLTLRSWLDGVTTVRKEELGRWLGELAMPGYVPREVAPHGWTRGVLIQEYVAGRRLSDVREMPTGLDFSDEANAAVAALVRQRDQLRGSGYTAEQMADWLATPVEFIVVDGWEVRINPKQ